jgi:predicted Zn-dependent protease
MSTMSSAGSVDFRKLISDFKAVVPDVTFWSLRLEETTHETLSVRENVVHPPQLTHSRGVHITFIDRGSLAYAATSELTRAGLRRACEHAQRWLDSTRVYGLFDADRIPRPQRSGSYTSNVQSPWEACSLDDKLTLLQDINRALKVGECIVDWQAHLTRRRSEITLFTSDAVEIRQCFDYLVPGYAAVANKGAQTQMRSGGGWGAALQGGLERLDDLDFSARASRIGEEAAQLVDAPECPTATASLLLMPNQMTLQIHESIGHPLELDRILGDERNFAGTSFVTLDMFGVYQYGSELLNVSFDPSLPAEVASYGFDDDGFPAERTWLIRHGILQRPLGGAASQARAGIAGVANARACAWNRPAIDRMANLNVEPGDRSVEELVSSIEFGVLMDTNRSWSIDDSRNKFQFGCELGRVIRNGELKELVRNPNYRGISANFWRNLVGVGDRASFEVWGTPYCGKGEPGQMIHVGHASPPCVFRDVDVFGGD